MPTQAVQINKQPSRGFIDRESIVADAASPHLPWHIAFRPLWHEYHLISSVLQYEVSHMPTLRESYYEGIVAPMPNICCRAKTLEQLQDQLLKQYAKYLMTLREHSNSSPLKGPLEGARIAQPDLHLPKIQQETEGVLARRQRIYMSQFGSDVNFTISNVKE